MPFTFFDEESMAQIKKFALLSCPFYPFPYEKITYSPRPSYDLTPFYRLLPFDR